MASSSEYGPLMDDKSGEANLDALNIESAPFMNSEGTRIGEKAEYDLPGGGRSEG